jgi:hypothetical protein
MGNENNNNWTNKDTFDTLRIIDAKLTRMEVDGRSIRHDLKEHIRRTKAAEARLDTLEEIWDSLQTHLHKVEGMMLLAKWLGGSVAIVLGLMELLRLLTDLGILNQY